MAKAASEGHRSRRSARDCSTRSACRRGSRSRCPSRWPAPPRRSSRASTGFPTASASANVARARHGRQRHRGRRARRRRRARSCRCRSPSRRTTSSPGFVGRAHAGLRASRSRATPRRPSRRRPPRPRSARTSSPVTAGRRARRAWRRSGGAGARRARRDPDAPRRPRRARGPAAARARAASGCSPARGGWVQAAVEQLERRRDQLAAAGNPAEALARRIGRTIPLVYGAGPIGGGGRDAVEVRRQRERQGARVLQPRPRAVPQRDLRLGPARRRHPPGVHPRDCATTTSTPSWPAGSSWSTRSRRGRRRHRGGARRGRRAARPAPRPRALRRPHVDLRWPSRRVSTRGPIAALEFIKQSLAGS